MTRITLTRFFPLNLRCAANLIGALACALALALPAAAAPRHNPNVYVGNLGPPESISVIGSRTNKVVATIPDISGNLFPFALAVSPDGRRLYVGNSFFANVMVIDTGTNQLVATITVPGDAGPLTVTPDGKRVYVSNGANSISVIDTSTNTVVDTISGLVGDVAASPDNRRIYIVGGSTVPNTATLSVLSTLTNTVIATIPIPESAGRIAVTPDGEHVYVGGFSHTFVISAESNTIVDTIPAAGALAISPKGDRLFELGGDLPGMVLVIAIPENKIIDTITVENAPNDVAVTRNGQHVYVTNEGSHTVSVISAATDKVIATISGFHAPSPVATQPARSRHSRDRNDDSDDPN